MAADVERVKEEIEEGVNILLERGWQPYQILTEALVGGMTIGTVFTLFVVPSLYMLMAKERSQE